MLQNLGNLVCPAFQWVRGDVRYMHGGGDLLKEGVLQLSCSP